MNPFPIRRAAALLATVACVACGDDDRSLRDALDSLPRDTASVATPVPAEVDTVSAESASADVLFPEARDTTPWVPEPVVPTAGPGVWTAGIVAGERPEARMTTLESVRVARHPEFDRVVLEFSGDDLPGYRLEYVDRPIRECGSGEVVQVAGDGWLSVRLTPSQAHDERGRATLRDRVIRPSVTNLLEMRMVCDFEGQVEWILGVRSPSPFRVLELFEPARLAIDVEF
jgi:hypothetical protein